MQLHNCIKNFAVRKAAQPRLCHPSTPVGMLLQWLLWPLTYSCSCYLALGHTLAILTSYTSLILFISNINLSFRPGWRCTSIA